MGAVIFFLTLFEGGPFWPTLLLCWVANPLFWFGISSLRRGSYGRAAALGCAGSLSASLPLLFLARSIREEPSRLPMLAGYFAWLASIGGLAVVGLIEWWGQGPRPRPQFRLGTLMIVIFAIALMLAALFRV